MQCRCLVFLLVYCELIVVFCSVHGDPDVKPATTKKMCGGVKVNNRKMSRSWTTYDAKDRDGQE